uniref:Uncharacterized protein n=1 Tax=Arundo donax TaxID=35708 RepID=A0A0A8ZHP8_ARUDO
MHAAKSMKLNLLVLKETVLCLPQCIRYYFVEQYNYTGYREIASLLISVPQDWELGANLNSDT